MALHFWCANVSFSLEAVKNWISKGRRRKGKNHAAQQWQRRRQLPEDRGKYFIIINKMISIVHSSKMTEKKEKWGGDEEEEEGEGSSVDDGLRFKVNLSFSLCFFVFLEIISKKGKSCIKALDRWRLVVVVQRWCTVSVHHKCETPYRIRRKKRGDSSLNI